MRPIWLVFDLCEIWLGISFECVNGTLACHPSHKLHSDLSWSI